MVVRFIFRKSIALWVILAFLGLLCTSSSTATWAVENGSGTEAVSPETDSEADVIEHEGGGERTVEKSSFPWGIVLGLGLLVGAAAVYFLVVKKSKEYTLTVTLGTGVTGTPAATAKYKKDSVVSYTYSAQSGYTNLAVLLDGTAVAASGTVTMSADHSLSISAVQGSSIQVNSTPAGAQIFMNTVNSGFVTPHTFNYTTAVTKTVLLRLTGYNDFTQTVTANLGEQKVINAVLTVKPQGSSIEVDSTPAGAQIFINNVDSGEVTPHTFDYTTAVTKNVLLKMCGYEDYTKSVTVALGHTGTVNATLKAGMLDNFSAASSCWLPFHSVWSVSGGYYKGTAATGFGGSTYNAPFSQTGSTVTAKLNLYHGSYASGGSFAGIFLSTGTDMTNAQGYMFVYYQHRMAIVYRFDGYNFTTGAGSYVELSPTSVWFQQIKPGGFNTWNEVKVVRSGSSYGFYANGVVMITITDSTYNPLYTSVVCASQQNTQLWVDTISQKISSTAVIPASTHPAWKPQRRQGSLLRD